MPRKPDYEARILNNSYLETETGCWIWIGRRNNGGYGTVTVRIPGRRTPVPVFAHRLAYETFTGKIPEGYEIDHKCVQNRCVNPAHLQAVAPRENKRLRDERRREALDKAA